MALKAAMWVHGTIVEAEYPTRFTIRKGWGTNFGGYDDTTNWFHIPITTPAILDDIRPKLIKVFVFYRTGFAWIRSLHVHDGPLLVKTFEGPFGIPVWEPLGGYNRPAPDDDHGWTIDAHNTWVLDAPLVIAFGLGISVGVEFDSKTITGSEAPIPNHQGLILFTAAGADFQAP